MSGGPYPSCAIGLACKETCEVSIPGACNTCVKEEKKLAQEGEVCEGFDESTGEAFPSCDKGLVCEPTCTISIPGACNSCVPHNATVLVIDEEETVKDSE